jgi:hypothetical protein
VFNYPNAYAITLTIPYTLSYIHSHPNTHAVAVCIPITLTDPWPRNLIRL